VDSSSCDLTDVRLDPSYALSCDEELIIMAYIAVVPPISFINIGSSVGTGPKFRNNANDVLILRAFMIYLQNFRKDMAFTKTRLETLAGSFDQDLRQMIIDYKTYKTKDMLAALAPGERGNDFVFPQDLRFALQSMSPAVPGRNTIMFLNSDVRPLAGYGDSIIEVMCNLFPIKGRLMGSPVTPEAYWRDLARNKVPWSKWLREQQELALSERQEANEILSDPKRGKGALSDEDKELFTLLRPYENDMKPFWENHTSISLSTSPSPSANFQAVTVKISVSCGGSQTPSGAVNLWFASVELMRIHGRAMVVSPSRALKVPLVKGSGTLTIPDVPHGSYIVFAEYPETGRFLGSRTQLPHEVN
jgi:hypothetical protein